jgi:DNA-binding NarL/FixJ family response regulator
MTKADPTKLSEAERKVLIAAARGFTIQETGWEVTPSVSLETVRTHRAKVLRKLGARSMTHALALALKAGQIKLSDL